MDQIIGNRRVRNCDTHFRKKMDTPSLGTPSLVLNDLKFSWKEAIKHEFFFCQNSHDVQFFSCHFKATLEGTWSRLSDGSCRYSTQTEGTLVSQRMLL